MGASAWEMWTLRALVWWPFPKAIAFAGHEDAVAPSAAVGAAEWQLDQRHSAVARLNQRGEVELRDVVAGRAARVNAMSTKVVARRG